MVMWLVSSYQGFPGYVCMCKIDFVGRCVSEDLTRRCEAIDDSGLGSVRKSKMAWELMKLLMVMWLVFVISGFSGLPTYM